MIRVYAEFDDATALVRAVDELQVRPRAHRRLEAYTPYAVPDLDRALGARPSRLSIFVFAAGLGGAAGAYGLQWLLNAYLYPLNVGGRPPHFPLAFVPITFEMGVLFAGLTTFAAIAWGAQMLRLWHPSREVPGIESATSTSFWLEVELPAGVDPDDMSKRLVDLGARTVRREVVP
jgi:hypothetical protein